MDIVTNHLNFNLRHCDKCEVAIKFIPLVTTSNLFSLEIVQKMTTLPTLCITGKLDYIDDRIDGPITMFRYLTFQEVINKIEISVSISAMN